MENLAYFLLDQNHFSLYHGDFPLKEKPTWKMKDVQVTDFNQEKDIKNLAEKAKDYARRIIVKIANHPDEYNQLTTADKLGRGRMMDEMRGIMTGDCFALSGFSLGEFHLLKSCVENTIENKKNGIEKN